MLLLDAIKNHNCALVHDLVHNHGLSPDFNVNGYSPICVAAQYGFVDILDILVEGGCSLITENFDTWKRQTVHVAASKGQNEFIKRLVSY
jgi:ankyrin repeat protein